MEDRNISTRLEPREYADLFLRRRRLQYLQRLITVGREDDVVEFMIPPVGGEHDPPVQWPYRRHLALDVYTAPVEASEHGVEVAPRPSRYGHPVWAFGDGAQEVVVVHEADQRDGGELQGAFIRARTPDGGRHGDQVVVPEFPGVVFSVEIITDTFLGCRHLLGLGGLGCCSHFVCRLIFVLALFIVIGLGLKEVQGELVEADNVEYHPPHSRAEDVFGLGKDGTERGPGPLEAALVAGDPERHLRPPRRDPDLVQKSYKVGVGRAVHDDEAGVDVDGGPGRAATVRRRRLEPDRVGVPAESRLGLEQVDLMVRTRVQRPEGRDARAPAPDDGHPLPHVAVKTPSGSANGLEKKELFCLSYVCTGSSSTPSGDRSVFFFCFVLLKKILEEMLSYLYPK